MFKLGQAIYNAFAKSAPIAIDGTIKLAKNVKFSLKNPYILEALDPTNYNINSLNIFEGKKLKTVCRIIDSPNYSQILNRYERFTKKAVEVVEDSISVTSQRIKNLNLYNSQGTRLNFFNFTKDGEIIVNPRTYGSKDLQFLEHIKTGQYVTPLTHPQGTLPCTKQAIAQSNKLAKSFISENEHFIDGYRYCSPHAQFDELGRDIAKHSCGQEIVIIDKTLDKILGNVIDTFKSRVNNNNLTGKGQIDELMRFVDEVFSSSQSEEKLCELTKKLCAINGNHQKEVLLGELINSGAGVCRHRSLLTKLLADETGLQCRFVQGYYGTGGHAWNEIITNGETYLFDAMQGKIFNITSTARNIPPQAFKYRITDPTDVNKTICKYFDVNTPVGAIYNGLKGKVPINTNEAVLLPTNNGYLIKPLTNNVKINGKQILEKTELSYGDFVNLKDIGFQII